MTGSSLYKCKHCRSRVNHCSSDSDCGRNEFCDSYLYSGQCHTLLSDGSLCLRSSQCLNTCSMGKCAECAADEDCPAQGEFCAYKYLPLVTNKCSGFCGLFCLWDSHCGGECGECSWGFTCGK